MEESLQNHVRSHSKLRSITSNWYFKKSFQAQISHFKAPKVFCWHHHPTRSLQKHVFESFWGKHWLIRVNYIYSISYITYTHILYYIYMWYGFPIWTIYVIYPVQKLQSTKLSSCETTEDGRLAESSDLKYRKFLEAATDLRFVIWYISANKIICAYLAW